MVDRSGCGVPVAKRTSWTRDNPGRRFIGCKFYNPETGQKGCNRFVWLDEDITDWQRDVTNDLVAEKQRLAIDNHILRARLTCIEHENGRLMEELRREQAGGSKADFIREEVGGKWSMVKCVVASVILSFVVVKLFA